MALFARRRTEMSGKIAFQGEPGAYSHEACTGARPDMEPMPCSTFEDAVDAVRSGAARLAMLPVENSIYGRVADIHRLLPESGLHIVGEHFVPIHINLLGIQGAALSEIRTAISHMVLLGQCREFIRQNGIRSQIWTDTAASAKHVAEAGDPTLAALASRLAGEIYGLEVIVPRIEDEKSNRTRFLVMSGTDDRTRRSEKMLTSFFFAVRNIPAALYKALGGFATHGVNMVKLDSHMVGGSFVNTQFFADVEGHPDDERVKGSLAELALFTTSIKILGVYPADPNRFGEAEST